MTRPRLTAVQVRPGGPVGLALPHGRGERQVTVAWTDDADGPETVHDVEDLILVPDHPAPRCDRIPGDPSSTKRSDSHG